MNEKGIIVGFTPALNREAKNLLHHTVGARFVREFISISADLVVVTSRLSVAEAIARYTVEEKVRYAEPDQRVHHYQTAPDQ